MSYENILYDVSERVATVTLNRPEALNATTDGMYHELEAIISQIAADTAVGCVILTGAGRGFCSGADLKARNPDATPLERRARHRWILRDILEPLVRLEKPVIAAVNGVAAGAGFSLALAADIIVMSEQAALVQSFVRIGLVPDLGGLYLLTRVIGLNKAKELCFTGRKVGAAEALQLGIANHVVAPADLMSSVRAMARGISVGPATSLAMMKTLLNKSSNASLEQMLEFEGFAQTIAYITPEHQEGVAAFKEKREPDFAKAAGL